MRLVRANFSTSVNVDWAADEDVGESALYICKKSKPYCVSYYFLSDETENTGADGITTIISYKLDEQGRKVKVHPMPMTEALSI